ncbi:hypothetical protein [Endozoicomonas sp. Mp262]|uniref:hypothetical protein n=1 Tax=Endozoicomonas sp. Mp262 TaxID=2919499 RepID=UPI0021E072EB
MTTSSHQWGGTRRNSGRPRGGVRDARRKIHAAISEYGEEGGAQVVTELILDNRGMDILKIWLECVSVYLESNSQKTTDKVGGSNYVSALMMHVTKQEQ